MAWTLRCPLISGNSLIPQSRLAVTAMEQGPARHVMTAMETHVQVTAGFDIRDEVELAIFWTHWDGEGKQGAAWFNMDLNVDGAVSTYSVRMFSPNITRQGLGYLLSASLDVRR